MNQKDHHRYKLNKKKERLVKPLLSKNQVKIIAYSKAFAETYLCIGDVKGHE